LSILSQKDIAIFCNFSTWLSLAVRQTEVCISLQLLSRGLVKLWQLYRAHRFSSTDVRVQDLQAFEGQ
jgi:hypothetical protein